MNFVNFVSFGFDEDGLALLDSQEGLEQMFQEFFDCSVNEMKEDDEYFFIVIDDLDNWISENKSDQYDQEQDEDFQNKLTQLKSMLDGRKYKLYEWSVEYDKNVLVVFEDWLR